MIDTLVALGAVMIAAGSGMIVGHAFGYARGIRSGVRRSQ